MRGGRKEYQTVADAMVESGMVAAGYTFMGTVCTGWLSRDPQTHQLKENLTNWPGGMKSFAAYLHARGMQLSVYTDAGKSNCCGEPGSLGYEEIDMKTFASWDVDAVGIDYCGGPPDVQGAFQKFADAIATSGRDMQLGMWNLGRGQAYKWAPEMSRNLTAQTADRPRRNGSFVPDLRLTPDIGNSWDTPIPPTMTVMATMDSIQSIPDLWDYGMGNNSGTFPNYGQMLVGVPPDHPTRGDPGLSLVEAQSHFSLWCMHASLMLATNDVRKRDKDIEKILLNPETLAISQDPWTLPSFRVPMTACAGEMWGRHLSNGDVAVLILNRANSSITTRLDWDAVTNATGVKGVSFAVRDIQARADLPVACSYVDFELGAHATAFVRLTRHATPCTPKAPPRCTAPAPLPPPPPPPAPAPAPHHRYPPLPPCPAGFTNHTSGYWANADEKGPTGHSKSVAECGVYCESKTGCKAFEVYDPARYEPIVQSIHPSLECQGLFSFEPST